MNLNSRKSLIARIRRSQEARKQFTESHLNKGLAYQLRATRDKLGWSQEELAKKAHMNQNAISRLESHDYGKPTITTLKRLAAAMDVGLVVRFVPFSEMVNWVSGTPYVCNGLTNDTLAVPSFDDEESRQVFAEVEASGPRQDVGAGAADSAVPIPRRQTVPLGALRSQEPPSAVRAAERPQ
jgi:transcriptional regulator with XRE-family HTH domain